MPRAVRRLALRSKSSCARARTRSSYIFHHASMRTRTLHPSRLQTISATNVMIVLVQRHTPSHHCAQTSSTSRCNRIRLATGIESI